VESLVENALRTNERGTQLLMKGQLAASKPQKEKEKFFEELHLLNEKSRDEK